LSSPSRIVSIVDDEPDITELFYDALQKIEDCHVFKFTDPALAIEHFKINMKDYAVMISDLRMPVINGMQLLKTVRDLNPCARTILMTAFSTEKDIFHEYNEKKIINRFLQKPISIVDILSEVRTQLDFYLNGRGNIPNC
jgi:DNA-binding NtrC family response regulator